MADHVNNFCFCLFLDWAKFWEKRTRSFLNLDRWFIKLVRLEACHRITSDLIGWEEACT